MFKRELELIGKENIEPIINQCTTCRIAMIADGKPYILPMVYGYSWEAELKLFLHCGLRGKKNRALRENPCVCFEMDIEGPLIGEGNLAHQQSRAFDSVIGEGIVEFVNSDDEKIQGFLYILKHQTGRDDWQFETAYLATAEVLCINVTQLRASRKTAPTPASSFHSHPSLSRSNISFTYDDAH